MEPRVPDLGDELRGYRRLPVIPLRKIVPHPTDPSLALVPLTRGLWAVIDAAFAEEAEAVVLAARAQHHGEFANDGKGMLS